MTPVIEPSSFCTNLERTGISSSGTASFLDPPKNPLDFCLGSSAFLIAIVPRPIGIGCMTFWGGAGGAAFGALPKLNNGFGGVGVMTGAGATFGAGDGFGPPKKERGSIFLPAGAGIGAEALATEAEAGVELPKNENGVFLTGATLGTTAWSSLGAGADFTLPKNENGSAFLAAGTGVD